MSHQSTFSNRLRLRTCGLLVEDGAVLLVKLRSPVTDQKVWMPPGGEVKYGESLKDSLEREFWEEVQLQIQVHSLLHVNELINAPFHAVELYFEVTREGDKQPGIGSDPELEEADQLIEDIEWVPLKELSSRNVAPQSLLPKLSGWDIRTEKAVFNG